MYIFASLPPAVLNFMVAERYNREPGKVAAIVCMAWGRLSVGKAPLTRVSRTQGAVTVSLSGW